MARQNWSAAPTSGPSLTAWCGTRRSFLDGLRCADRRDILNSTIRAGPNRTEQIVGAPGRGVLAHNSISIARFHSRAFGRTCKPESSSSFLFSISCVESTKAICQGSQPWQPKQVSWHSYVTVTNGASRLKELLCSPLSCRAIGGARLPRARDNLF